MLSPLHIRTSARQGSVGVAVLPPRQSDETFDCSFRDAEAKELSISAYYLKSGFDSVHQALEQSTELTQ